VNAASFVADMLLHGWRFLAESAPWLLFGFLAAGLLHGFLSADFVAAHLGRGRLKPVAKAALFGLPLPLCSCGVLPAAVGLRKKGATKGATVSFLISTPETGVDSIAFTWALLGPVMTVWRPLAALFTAFFAGAVETFAGREGEPVPASAPASGCGCSCSGEAVVAAPPAGWRARVREGIGYAFGDLLKDLAPWLGVGILAAGAISAAMPENYVAEALGTGWAARVTMLLVGIPLYICATASTPVAAALMAKGLSPGAALVFLLAGPATNTASVAALQGTLGRATTIRYLLSIAAGSLLMGWALDALFPGLTLPAGLGVAGGESVLPPWVEGASAVLLIALSLRVFLPGRAADGCAPSGSSGGG